MAIALTRTIILYLLIIIGIRLMGKRQIGQLEPSELVLSLLIADLAAVPMQDFGIPLLTGIIPIVALLAVSTALSFLAVKSIRFRALLCSRPSIVIENGAVLPQQMKKNRFTLDELMEELRMNGITDPKQVKYAILETNGRLSVILYATEQPVTAKQMKVQTQETGLPLIVVSDGRILSRNMELCGIKRSWLDQQLKERGIHDVKDVFLLTVDEKKNVYFTAKEGVH